MIVQTHTRPRWQWWRDLVLLMQTVAIVCLVVVAMDAKDAAAKAQAEAARSDQRAVVERAELQRQISALSRDLHASRLENERLTRLLLANQIDPASRVIPYADTRTRTVIVPAPAPSPTPAPVPTKKNGKPLPEKKR